MYIIELNCYNLDVVVLWKMMYSKIAFIMFILISSVKYR